MEFLTLRGIGSNICIMTQVRKQKVLTPRQAAACCGALDELLDVELFKGLCDSTRLALLGCLAKCGRACSVTELAECCSVDFSVVSRHLISLERSGVVESQKKGRSVLYTVKYADLSGRLHALADAIESYGPSQSGAPAKGGCCGRA
jgi:DNA-binding transcriptional ArsR family regulator